MREHLTKASRKAKAEFSEERSPAEGKEVGSCCLLLSDQAVKS